MENQADITQLSTLTGEKFSNTTDDDLEPASDASYSFLASDLTPCKASEWIQLVEGEQVVVQRDSDYPKTGRVDVVSKDALVFWVSLDNGEGRILIDAEDNAKVWLPASGASEASSPRLKRVLRSGSSPK